MSLPTPLPPKNIINTRGTIPKANKNLKNHHNLKQIHFLITLTFFSRTLRSVSFLKSHFTPLLLIYCCILSQIIICVQDFLFQIYRQNFQFQKYLYNQAQSFATHYQLNVFGKFIRIIYLQITFIIQISPKIQVIFYIFSYFYSVYLIPNLSKFFLISSVKGIFLI